MLSCDRTPEVDREVPESRAGYQRHVLADRIA